MKPKIAQQAIRTLMPEAIWYRASSINFSFGYLHFVAASRSLAISIRREYTTKFTKSKFPNVIGRYENTPAVYGQECSHRSL